MGRTCSAPRVVGVADLLVNLTLHHDENFGLAQVEAMACGTPVVGTSWGGLNDTIVDGVSGYRVSTVVTPVGVKASWWEAANRIVALLLDVEQHAALRASSLNHARAEYAPARFSGRLECAVTEALAGRPASTEPLRPTAFATQFWERCTRPGARPYRPGGRPYRLYRDLITPYAGSSSEHIPVKQPLAPGQIVSLACPIAPGSTRCFRADDALYPLEFDVPKARRAAFDQILTSLQRAPVAPLADLVGAPAQPELAAGLSWMLRKGLVLRSVQRVEWLLPGSVGEALAQPLFSVQWLRMAEADLTLI